MKKGLLVAAIILLGALFASLWLYPSWWLTLVSSCDETVTTKINNASYLVEEKVKNCGTTSDYATEYTIRNTKTNVMDTALSLKGDLTDSCSMEWKTQNLLVINCQNGGDFIYQQKDKFEDVAIQYYQNGSQKFKEEPVPTRVAYECKNSKYLTVSYNLDNVNVQAYEGNLLVSEEDLSKKGEKYTNADGAINFWSEGDAQMSTFLQVNNQIAYDCRFQTLIHNGELRE